MKKILITMRVPKDTLDMLSKNFELDYNDSLEFLPKDVLKEKVKNADAALIPLSEKWDKEIIDSAKNLKIIANFGAGYDNIDIEAASEKGIIVTNAPAKGSTNATAEIAMGLIVDIMRGITRGEEALRKGEFKGWKPTFGLGPVLYGKTLGIFGLGRIGKGVAARAKAFGMNVIYNSRTKLEDAHEKELGVKYVEFNELLKTSDVISLNPSYSKELHHLFNEEAFKKMKPSAYLVNTSRGPIIDEKALSKALENKMIKGAAIDVYEFEPAVTESLLKLDNIVLSPHLGNASIEARDEMGMMTAKNILAVLNGEEAPNKVN